AMEREPHRRYASAAEMKGELDNPETVKVTGRHHHLRSPKVWKANWQGSRLIVLSAVIPLLLFAGALFLTRCHAVGH
ncbi:MAG TPA: hypothetical protein VGD78_10770, partial [Chthoniobacterales bacterium]